MTLPFSLDRARHTLHVWLRGEEKDSLAAATEGPAERNPDSPEERISQFMEELKASPQEWLGRVRTINLDPIRERVGPRWRKLQDRVEILAEKIIQAEMTGHDRYLKVCGTEFLVFFSDATPEESRIRCFAIVETIQEKLFGASEAEVVLGDKIAECRLIHKDDLALERKSAGPSCRSQPPHPLAAKPVGAQMRSDAEILDGADIAASTQIVIDSIISRGAESQSLGELTPLLLRLQILSRSLKTLEPALIKAARMPGDPNNPSMDGTQTDHGGDSPQTESADGKTLGTAWEDIAELVSVLGVGSEQSHADLLAAVARLRRARLERAAKALADNGASPAGSNLDNTEPMEFEYTPVYRSTSRGERIHQGIYRVTCRVKNQPSITGDDDFGGYPRHESMESERAKLEHTIQYLLDRRTSARFMLMTSVHVETLRGPNSQMRYSTILRSAQLRAKKRLLIEVVGYCDGDDTIGVRRAIDELLVHSQAVFISLSRKGFANVEKMAMECKRSGAHAIGLDASQFHGQDAEVIDAITRLSSLGDQYSIPTFVDGIRSVPALAKAIANGINYLCAPALHPPLPTPDDAERATLDDLYVVV